MPVESGATLLINYQSIHMIFIVQQCTARDTVLKGTEPCSLYLSPRHLNNRWPNKRLQLNLMWEKTRNILRLQSLVMTINK